MVDGVVIKVRRHDVGGHIVGRMLHRRKGVDLLSKRQNHDAAGVLPRRPPDARAALCEALELTAALADPAVLAVSERVAVGRLVRHRRDGPCLEGLLVAEDYLRIRMRLRLVLAGEIQVDIRLLVALKAQERLKRNVKAGTHQLLSAVGAHLHRHVHAAFSGIGLHLLRFEIGIMAMLAVIVRRQRIHLRDSGHGRHKGRAHGAAGADEVSVLVGLPHQLLRDDVHNGISVFDDGGQLPLQPVAHHLRQRIAVHFMCLPITDFAKLSVRVLDDRRAFVRPDRRNGIHPVRNAVWIGDDNLLALSRAQVGEFLHHLIRRPQVERCRILLPVHAHAVLDDRAVDLILRIQEMHIARRHNRLSVLLAQLHDLPVDVQHVLLALDVLIAVGINQEPVVGPGLNLQIIVKINDPSQCLLILLSKKRLIELAHDARRADDDPLPVLHQERLRYLGLLVKICQMRLTDHPIEVGAAGHIFGQKNAMVRAKTPDDIRILISQRVHLLQRRCSLCRKHSKELYEDLRRRLRIVHSPVVVRVDHVQELADGIQVVGFVPRQHDSCHSDRIDRRIGSLQSQFLSLAPDKADIEADIVSDQHAAFAEFQEPGQHVIDGLCRHDHLIGDAGEARDAEGNGNLRIDELRELARALPVLIPDRADLDDPVLFRGKAGGLEIENHVGAVRRGVVRLPDFQASEGHHLLLIIHEITFHTVDHLEELLAVQRREALPLPRLVGVREELFHDMVGIRKGLHISVIRDGNRRPPPFIGPLYEGRALGNAVHIAHLRMHVELHALVVIVIGALGFKGRNLHDARRRGYRNLVLEGILLGIALDLHEIPRLQPLHGLLRIHGRGEDFDNDGIRKVRQRELQDGLLVADIPALIGHDFAADRHLSHLADDVRNRDGFIRKIAAADDIRAGRADEAPQRLCIAGSLRVFSRILVRCLVSRSPGHAALSCRLSCQCIRRCRRISGRFGGRSALSLMHKRAALDIPR